MALKVVHLSRTFLHSTETFVYTQIMHLQRTWALALVRDLRNLALFPNVRIRAFCTEPKNWRKVWSDLSYRSLRRMTRYERRYFRTQISSLSPDLFHAHYPVDAAYFLDLKRQFGIPLIVSCYGYDVSSFPNRYLGLGRYYLQPVWKHADLVLAMSKDMYNDLVQLGCPEKKIKIHYHGINLSRFEYVERLHVSDNIRILFVGTLSNERKGVEYLIRAFAKVVRLNPQVELRLVGNGQDRFERLVRSLGIENKVSFAGFVRHEHIKNELQAAHIFCHPSVTLSNNDKEGIPGTIVEAMATGLPVVATKHAGIPEMVTNGEHGFVVPERDVDGIVQSILTLINNPTLRYKLGREAARQVREKGDAIRQTAKLEAIYQEVIDYSKENS